MYVIVILAMIAGFLAMRLYSVLGKRTGHEQEPAPRPADERAKVTVLQPRPATEATGDSVRLAEGPCQRLGRPLRMASLQSYS